MADQIKHFFWRNTSVLMSATVFVAVFVVFVVGVNGAAASQQGEALRVAKDSISRAVISYYAINGNYPESYEALKSAYNLRINEEKYAVFYDIFASNIMPDITVIER